MSLGDYMPVYLSYNQRYERALADLSSMACLFLYPLS